MLKVFDLSLESNKSNKNWAHVWIFIISFQQFYLA